MRILFPPPFARSYSVFLPYILMVKSSYCCVPKLYFTLLTLILLILGILFFTSKQLIQPSSVFLKIVLRQSLHPVCRIVPVRILHK